MPVWTHAEEIAALENNVSALRTKLAMREQQLREADARQSAWRGAYVALYDWVSALNATTFDDERTEGDCSSHEDAKDRAWSLAEQLGAHVRALRLRYLKAVNDMDDLRMVAVRADMQRIALAERVGSTEPEAAPEPWEAILTAALRWRRGTDRGELAAAVDALLGQYVGPQGSVAIVGGVLYPQKEALRPEQYADGAGAQAWRQAMGGKL